MRITIRLLLLPALRCMPQTAVLRSVVWFITRQCISQCFPEIHWKYLNTAFSYFLYFKYPPSFMAAFYWSEAKTARQTWWLCCFLLARLMGQCQCQPLAGESGSQSSVHKLELEDDGQKALSTADEFCRRTGQCISWFPTRTRIHWTQLSSWTAKPERGKVTGALQPPGNGADCFARSGTPVLPHAEQLAGERALHLPEMHLSKGISGKHVP